MTRSRLTVLGHALLQLLLQLLLLLLHPGQLLAVPSTQAVEPLGQAFQTLPLCVHPPHLSLQLPGTAEVITWNQTAGASVMQDSEDGNGWLKA